jgi:hypothetical protein
VSVCVHNCKTSQHTVNTCRLLEAHFGVGVGPHSACSFVAGWVQWRFINGPHPYISLPR